MEERTPRPIKHLNHNADNATPAGHSASGSNRGTAHQNDGYADVQSILKVKYQQKTLTILTNPERKSPTKKDECSENNQNGTIGSEYELAREVTESLFDTEMVVNPYYDSSG